MVIDPPGAPEKPTASDIDSHKMTVSWSPPKSDGGSPIIGYTVDRKDVTSSRWITVNTDLVSETSHTVTGLNERSEYQFRVTAENKAGPGPASEPSDVYMAKPPYGNKSPVMVVS